MNFDISGAAIYFRIPTGIPVLGDILITETLVVSWIVMALITGLCLWLTRGLTVENISKKQAFAEMLVEMAANLVRNNTGGTRFDRLIPFVAALFATSVVSNLISLIGLRSPTADLSTEAAWAVVVFTMITANKIRAGGFLGYLKGFTTPIAVMTPFNILSELATPGQYGLPPFWKHPVRCGHQRTDLRRPGGSFVRPLRTASRSPGQQLKPHSHSGCWYPCYPVGLL